MTSIRKTPILWIALAILILGTAAVALFIWRFRNKHDAPSVPTSSVTKPEASAVPPPQTTLGPIDEVFHSLASDELLPKFKPFVEGVEWELLLAEPFQQGGKSYAIAAFANYMLDGDGKRVDAHGQGADICPALFAAEPDGAWRCIEFNARFTNFGSWGNAGNVALCHLGPERWGISLSSGFTNQGDSSVKTWYFELGPPTTTGGPPTLALNEVLVVQNSLGHQEESWETETRFTDTVVNEHYVVSVKLKGQSSKDSVAEAGEYEFSPAAGKYVKRKSP